MKRKLIYTMLFVSGIWLLKSGMNFLLKNQESTAHFGQVVQQHELEPAVFFYTDSPQALRSEKIVRKNVSQLK